MANQDNRPGDRVENAGDRCAIAGNAAQRIRSSNCRKSIFLQFDDHAVPARRLGKCPMHEYDGRLGLLIGSMADRARGKGDHGGKRHCFDGISHPMCPLRRLDC
jgi:hypothetical protein